RRRVTLQLEYPATVSEALRESWAISTFGAIALDDFAAGLALSIDELAAAAADDQVLTTVLAVQASQARRFDLLARLVREGASDAWGAMVLQTGGVDITPESVADWSTAAIQPDLWTQLPVIGLMLLYGKLRHPLPQQVAERLLASKVWRNTL